MRIIASVLIAICYLIWIILVYRQISRSNQIHLSQSASIDQVGMQTALQEFNISTYTIANKTALKIASLIRWSQLKTLLLIKAEGIVNIRLQSKYDSLETQIKAIQDVNAFNLEASYC